MGTTQGGVGEHYSNMCSLPNAIGKAQLAGNCPRVAQASPIGRPRARLTAAVRRARSLRKRLRASERRMFFSGGGGRGWFNNSWLAFTRAITSLSSKLVLFYGPTQPQELSPGPVLL